MQIKESPSSSPLAMEKSFNRMLMNVASAAPQLTLTYTPHYIVPMYLYSSHKWQKLKGGNANALFPVPAERP